MFESKFIDDYSYCSCSVEKEVVGSVAKYYE